MLRDKCQRSEGAQFDHRLAVAGTELDCAAEPFDGPAVLFQPTMRAPGEEVIARLIGALRDGSFEGVQRFVMQTDGQRHFTVTRQQFRIGRRSLQCAFERLACFFKASHMRQRFRKLNLERRIVGAQFCGVLTVNQCGAAIVFRCEEARDGRVRVRRAGIERQGAFEQLASGIRVAQFEVSAPELPAVPGVLRVALEGALIVPCGALDFTLRLLKRAGSGV